MNLYCEATPGTPPAGEYGRRQLDLPYSSTRRGNAQAASRRAPAGIGAAAFGEGSVLYHRAADPIRLADGAAARAGGCGRAAERSRRHYDDSSSVEGVTSPTLRIKKGKLRPCAASVTRIMQKVRRISKSRWGKASPLSRVCGSDMAAAKAMTPRIPV